jgi:sugar phosphate permease
MRRGHVSDNYKHSGLGSHPYYPWIVVGLLWFCGFFNYADRQALSAVLPMLGSEFDLSDYQIGWVSSAFMVVYAITSPFTGWTVDWLSRRLLIPLGLAFWSLICVATGFARNFVQIVLLRAAEGLGESFYFPASMSVLADYHGPQTRSRAMSIHQTSVYLGTAGGWALGGMLADHYGWRSPFWVLGLAGMAYAVMLGFWLVEPSRARGDAQPDVTEPTSDDERNPSEDSSDPLLAKVARILTNPGAVVLLAVFVGANFVATTFLSWLPMFVSRKFHLNLGDSGLTSTVWPLASLPGALIGGVLADRAFRRWRGGRIGVQSLGLILAAPFVYLTGLSSSWSMLVAALVGAGFCKGIYDANIFASLYDVVRPEDRGTAAGLMNTVGWSGGSIAPPLIGMASDHFGLSVAITATAAVYLLVGLLALSGARLAGTRVVPK